MENVARVPVEKFEYRSGGYNERISGPDPNMRNLMPNPERLPKCLACTDITKIVPLDKMVGCVPYETEEQHFRILRSDGLSHHPLRRNNSADISGGEKSQWKAPMGLFGAAATPYPVPPNWREEYRKTMPWLNDFLVPDTRNGGGDRADMTANAYFEVGKRSLEDIPLEERMAFGMGYNGKDQGKNDPGAFRRAVAADDKNAGKYYAMKYMPQLGY
eukprot:CAMPEP_0178993714 /NCGR_PEP_ID=MMETSP0795-20121207/6861_1 /TAXON_ID=88552 /ORGANISM="Amoebophrya sp., Strain Ameob2" /LENGTH=215 /DNA_ID=CAMNT_0020685813 /DNA_START=405 /DNA_END=1052 /DNA_ORIENTATION=-